MAIGIFCVFQLSFCIFKLIAQKSSDHGPFTGAQCAKAAEERILGRLIREIYRDFFLVFVLSGTIAIADISMATRTASTESPLLGL